MPTIEQAIEVTPRDRTVQASMVQLYVTFGIKFGLSPSAMYDAAGITEAQIAVAAGQVPYRWLQLVRGYVIRSLPERTVGLELGNFAALEQYGYMGQACKHSATARASIILFSELVMLVHQVTLPHPTGTLPRPQLIDEGDREVWVMARLPDEPSESFESLFVATINNLRKFTGHHVCPRAVRFMRCKPRHLAAYEEFFQAPVETDQPFDAMYFDHEPLDLPMLTADAAACAHFRAQFERQVAAQGDPFRVALERVIEGAVVAGRLSQAYVATQLGLTTRTLQRRCRERGINYRLLVDHARRNTALSLLGDQSLNINEVALAVGYDISSFNRVFRAWTGMSPSVYRKRAPLLSARAY